MSTHRARRDHTKCATSVWHYNNRYRDPRCTCRAGCIVGGGRLKRKEAKDGRQHCGAGVTCVRFSCSRCCLSWTARTTTDARLRAKCNATHRSAKLLAKKGQSMLSRRKCSHRKAQRHMRRHDHGQAHVQKACAKCSHAEGVRRGAPAAVLRMVWCEVVIDTAMVTANWSRLYGIFCSGRRQLLLERVAWQFSGGQGFGGRGMRTIGM